jgi:hypothetical protein
MRMLNASSKFNENMSKVPYRPNINYYSRLSRRPARHVVPSRTPHPRLPVQALSLPRARNLPRPLAGGAHRMHELGVEGGDADFSKEEANGRATI